MPLALASDTNPATCFVLQPLEALGHLRRLQLWRNLALHAYHHAADFARQQQQTTVRQFMQLMHLMQKASGVCPATCLVCPATCLLPPCNMRGVTCNVLGVPCNVLVTALRPAGYAVPCSTLHAGATAAQHGTACCDPRCMPVPRCAALLSVQLRKQLKMRPACCSWQLLPALTLPGIPCCCCAGGGFGCSAQPV